MAHCHTSYLYPLVTKHMPIFQAIGLGILILVLQSLAPAVLSQAESTAISFLRGAEVSAVTATSLAASASSATNTGTVSTDHSDFRLPQATQITRF